jgi:hypothetical protein
MSSVIVMSSSDDYVDSDNFVKLLVDHPLLQI